jgi:hypothetical protein
MVPESTKKDRALLQLTSLAPHQHKRKLPPPLLIRNGPHERLAAVVYVTFSRSSATENVDSAPFGILSSREFLPQSSMTVTASPLASKVPV